MASINSGARSAPRRIRHIGPLLRRLDSATIAEAMGALDAGLELTSKGSPVTLFQVRAALMSRLQSNVGDPVVEATNRRVRIPVTDSQWQELEGLATSLSDTGFTPSPDQIATALLTVALPLLKKEIERLKQELRSNSPSPEPAR
jgi:hypothetical protein